MHVPSLAQNGQGRKINILQISKHELDIYLFLTSLSSHCIVLKHPNNLLSMLVKPVFFVMLLRYENNC